MPTYHLAQLNIARPLAPLDSPLLAEFKNNISRVNRLAENASGFVWRMIDGEEGTDADYPFGSEYIVNLSVWADVQSLSHFAFRTEHAEFLKRRREWFAKTTEAYSVLWWIPVGHTPTLLEASEKLAELSMRGPNPEAFTFKNVFPPADHFAESAA